MKSGMRPKGTMRMFTWMALSERVQGHVFPHGKGKHTITVTIADRDHKDAGTATDSITVKVVK
jgi:hypothetical protein